MKAASTPPPVPIRVHPSLASLILRLARLGCTRGKVVLLDGDPNRSALSWYERGQKKSVFSVMDGDQEPSEFDYLIIDTPARTDPTELLPLASASDLLIISSEISIFSLEATIATVSILQSLSDDKYRILLTQQFSF